MTAIINFFLNVLANFLILSESLLFKYFPFYGYLGNLDPDGLLIRLINSTVWRQIMSSCQSYYDGYIILGNFGGGMMSGF